MCSTTNNSTTPTMRRAPLYVWLLIAIGALGGAFLAEPGDVWANTVPSAATFAVVGLIVGLVVWALQRRVNARR